MTACPASRAPYGHQEEARRAATPASSTQGWCGSLPAESSSGIGMKAQSCSDARLAA